MSSKPRSRAATMMIVRQFHTYLAVFIAPSVLFFALTGALQLFGLHESRGPYTPPPLIEKLGMVHKDQVFMLKPRRAPPKAQAAGQSAEIRKPPAKEEARKPRQSTALLKDFFLAVSMALVATTGLGLWVALTQSRRRGLVWVLLVAGAVTPLAIFLVP
jgi:hypothetical protein